MMPVQGYSPEKFRKVRGKTMVSKKEKTH